MENNLKNVISSIIPDAEITEKGPEEITTDIKAGIKTVTLSIITKNNMVILKGIRKYSNRVSELERIKFNNDMIMNHPEYQIYAEKDYLSIAKRSSVESVDDAAKTITDYIHIVKEVTLQFEEKCIDFGAPYIAEKSQEDISVIKIDQQEGQPLVTHKEDIDQYLKYQQYFCNDTFQRIASDHGCTITENGTKKYISYNVEGGTMEVSNGNTSIRIDFSAECASSVAYMIIAEVEKHYPKYNTEFEQDSNILHLFCYVIPDPYLPQAAENTIAECVNVFKECSITVEKESGRIDDLKVATQMQEILQKQTQELLAKENELCEKEKEIEEKAIQVSKLQENILAEKQEAEEKLYLKERELSERETRVSELEQKTQKMFEEANEERNKYLLTMHSLTGDMAKLQAMIRGTSSEDAREEIAKLKSQLVSATECRVAMEKKLKGEINESNRKYNDLLKSVQEKQVTIDELKSNINNQVSKLSDKERQEYESEIRRLKEAMDITGDEVNVDSFMGYLEKKEGYLELKKLHAENKEILSCKDASGSLDIKIVFGDLLFMDVRKKAKAKSTSLCELNNKLSEIKFFENEGFMIARRHFGRCLCNAELETLLIDLIEMFETGKGGK